MTAPIATTLAALAGLLSLVISGLGAALLLRADYVGATLALTAGLLMLRSARILFVGTTRGEVDV
jgi:hypothetical protein